MVHGGKKKTFRRGCQEACQRHVLESPNYVVCKGSLEVIWSSHLCKRRVPEFEIPLKMEMCGWTTCPHICHHCGESSFIKSSWNISCCNLCLLLHCFLLIVHPQEESDLLSIVAFCQAVLDSTKSYLDLHPQY